MALWRDHVITDTAHDIKRLIEAAPTFDGRDLVPGDIAVLAARRNELDAIQHALADVGVPSVVNAGGSVFHTPAAAEWLTLLEALEQPHRSDRVRACALTSFFGYTAESLDAGGDALTDTLASRVRTLADVFTRRGVAAVLEATAVEGLTARVLGRVGGERTLTDLRHIGESLLRVSTEQRMGLVGLLAWLREQVADEKLEVASERTRRLDSDAAAVQLVTIHGSKGLQYPVVYLPTLWNRYTGRDPAIPLFHDDEGRRCRDVGGPSAFHRQAVGRYWSRGRRRVAAPALRRPHAGPVAGRRVVRPRRAQHSRLPAAPDAVRPPPGDGAGPRHVGCRRRGPDAHDPPGLAVRRRPGHRAGDVGPARPHAARRGPPPT